MASVSAAHLIIFIGVLAVTGAFMGSFTDQTSQIMAAYEERAEEQSAEMRTEITIIDDPQVSVYNDTTNNVTFHVKNIGERTLPTDPETIDVFIDGEHQPIGNLTVTLPASSEWYEREVATITVSDVSLGSGEHRIKIVVTGGTATFEFEEP
ncbi:MAG: hypothetical protein SVG88_04730 [Halobacteriales archaeon]|nr:hypothetical protein [Halobacteriales archaeon]